MSKMNLSIARVGIVAEMMENGKKFVLTSISPDKTSGTMVELIDDDAVEDFTAQVIPINKNNQCMFNFLEDPNPQDVPEVNLAKGILTVDGNEVETGELEIVKVLQTVPGEVVLLVATDADDLYDVKAYVPRSDRWYDVLTSVVEPNLKDVGDGYMLAYYDQYTTVKVDTDKCDDDGVIITRDATVLTESKILLMKDGRVVDSEEVTEPLGELFKELPVNDGTMFIFQSNESISDDFEIDEVVPMDTTTRLTRVIVNRRQDEETGEVSMNLNSVRTDIVENDIQTITVARGNRILVKTASTVYYSNDGSRPKTLTSKVATKNAAMMKELKGFDVLTNYGSSDGRVTLFLRNDKYEVKTLTSTQTDKGIVLTVSVPDAE